jgi:hypothetical protein
VAGLRDHEDDQFLEVELAERCFRERDVPVVRWVERSAQEADH